MFVAISMGNALVLITEAFDRSKIKPSHYPKMLMLPIILPVIALGIALSSFILSKVSPLSFAQAITTVLVAGAIGVSLYLISGSLEKTKLTAGSIMGFVMLPIIVPAIALGIVLASFILSKVKTLTLG